MVEEYGQINLEDVGISFMGEYVNAASNYTNLTTAFVVATSMSAFRYHLPTNPSFFMMTPTSATSLSIVYTEDEDNQNFPFPRKANIMTTSWLMNSATTKASHTVVNVNLVHNLSW